MPSFDECGMSPICWGKGWVSDAASSVAGNVVDSVASAVATGTESVLGFVAKVVVGTDTVEVGNEPAVAWLQGSLHYMSTALAVVSVLVAGIFMIWQQRGAPLRDLARSLATLVVVSAAGVQAIDLLTSALDMYSSWLLKQSGGFDNLADSMVLFLSHTGALGAFLVIILGLFAIIAGLGQVCLLLVRSTFLLLMAGVLPLSASATNTSWGQQWFGKLITWIVAFIAYKPTVAIIFAFGLRILDLAGANTTSVNDKIAEVCGIEDPTPEDYSTCIEEHPDEFGALKTDLMGNLTGFLQGLIFLLLAVVALPALMRLIVPSVAAMGSGGGGAAAGLAGAAVASGAVNLGGGSAGGMDVAGGTAAASSGGPSGAGASGGSQGPPGAGGAGGGEGPPGADGAAGTGGEATGAGAAGEGGPSGADGGQAAGAAAGAGGGATGAGAAAGAGTGGGAAAGAGGAAAGAGAAAATGGASVAVQAGIQAGSQVASGAQQVAEGETGG